MYHGAGSYKIIDINGDGKGDSFEHSLVELFEIEQEMVEQYNESLNALNKAAKQSMNLTRYRDKLSKSSNKLEKCRRDIKQHILDIMEL